MKPSGFVRLGWCKHAVARNRQGFSCPASHPDACEWCLMGACHAARIDLSPESPDRARLHRETGEVGLSYWNDYVAEDADEVIQLLERCGL